ncbi:5-methylcytosine restriction system specificity protein McrC [Maribacter stanieri]|uniref:5-methylcytosine restriction system specificity protein McrC n=1 Tax=Maribacter stanieri TaxID=440514 RepID=UPI0030DBA905|tara:strand:+ start:9737 stop:11056 length:1320 start_codon:yes stop_codon:yes gene_type:complete
MTESPILIEAKDCFPFKNQEGNGEAIQYFISNQKELNIFHLGNQQKSDDLEIAYFNTKDAKWYAGRLVGEAQFKYNEIDYKIVIKPRFGNLQLFRMLEEVFNIKLTHSKSNVNKQNDYQYLIKQLIAFLWLNLLSKANKHGIPKHNKVRYYKGATVRGRLDVRKSIIPLYVEEKIVSRYNEKVVDANISKILLKAYRILKSDYKLSSIKVSLGAKNAIEQILTSNIRDTYITESDFTNIKYNDIYKSFKPVVDLSWDIIKKKNFGNNNDKNSDSFSFFIDMAEVWEIYLRSILKRQFAKYGWKLRKDKIQTYKGKDFKRLLIPDIVLERGNDVMVWDAKYKRMEFDYFDYDRADFFQIHTYLNYYHQNRNVIAGGLLYPLSKYFSPERQFKNKSNSLFNQETTNTSYLVDGIDYTNLTEEKVKNEELNFLNRIAELQKN